MKSHGFRFHRNNIYNSAHIHACNITVPDSFVLCVSLFTLTFCAFKVTLHRGVLLRSVCALKVRRIAAGMLTSSRLRRPFGRISFSFFQTACQIDFGPEKHHDLTFITPFYILSGKGNSSHHRYLILMSLFFFYIVDSKCTKMIKKKKHRLSEAKLTQPTTLCQ